MKWLVRRYPAAWRERYGEEFAAVLENQPVSLGLLMDVIGGAVDARLHPQSQILQTSKVKGDDTMTNAMLQRCAAGGPKLSPRDQRIAGTFMILSALIIAGAYVALTKIYHSIPAVQALGYTSFPALSLIYTQAAYLRKRSVLTQVLICVSGLTALYLFMLASCLIAAKL
jgi:hypothetical protein